MITFVSIFSVGLFCALSIAFSTKGVTAVIKPPTAPIAPMTPEIFLFDFVPIQSPFPYLSRNLGQIKSSPQFERRTEKAHLLLLPHNPLRRSRVRVKENTLFTKVIPSNAISLLDCVALIV